MLFRSTFSWKNYKDHVQALYQVHQFVNDEPVQKNLYKEIWLQGPIGDDFWEEHRIPLEWRGWIITLIGHTKAKKEVELVAGELFGFTSLPKTPYQSASCLPRVYATCGSQRLWKDSLEPLGIFGFIRLLEGIDFTDCFQNDYEFAHKFAQRNARAGSTAEFNQRRDAIFSCIKGIFSRADILDPVIWSYRTRLELQPKDLPDDNEEIGRASCRERV